MRAVAWEVTCRRAECGRFKPQTRRVKALTVTAARRELRAAGWEMCHVVLEQQILGDDWYCPACTALVREWMRASRA